MRTKFYLAVSVWSFGCSPSVTGVSPLDPGGLIDARVEDQAVDDSTIDMRGLDMLALDAASRDATTVDSGVDAGPITDAAGLDATAAADAIVDATLIDMAPQFPPSRVGQNCHAAQPCEPDLLCINGLCADAPVIHDSWAIWADDEVQARIMWTGPWLKLVLGDVSAAAGPVADHDPDLNTSIIFEFDAPQVPEHIEVQLRDGTVVARIPVVIQQTSDEGTACLRDIVRWQAAVCEPGSMCAFEPTEECPTIFDCDRPHAGLCRVPEVLAVQGVDGHVIFRVRLPQLTGADRFRMGDGDGVFERVLHLTRMVRIDDVGLYRSEFRSMGAVHLYHEDVLLLSDIMPVEQQVLGEGDACAPFGIEAICGEGMECIDGACQAPEPPVIETVSAVAGADGFAIRLTGRAVEEAGLAIRLRVDGQPVYRTPSFGDLSYTRFTHWDGPRFETVYSGVEPLPFDPATATVEVAVNQIASAPTPLAPHLAGTADQPRGVEGTQCDFREAILPCAAPLRCFSSIQDGRNSACRDVTVRCVPRVDGDLELDTPIRIDDIPRARQHPHPANNWSSCDPFPREGTARYFNFTAPEADDYVFSVGSGGTAHFAIRARCEDGRSELACAREPRAVDGVHTVRTTLAIDAGQTVTMVVMQQDWFVAAVERAP